MGHTILAFFIHRIFRSGLAYIQKCNFIWVGDFYLVLHVHKSGLCAILFRKS